ncbi:MAG: hypothetical protein U5K54_08445 [Cytophagales bacterium]|nr:hypothetical protein [Cytophagales bacterium]
MGTDGEYERRKVKFRKEVASVKSESCTKFLQDFLSYFKDGHLFVFEQPTYSEEEIALSKKESKTIKKVLKVFLVRWNWKRIGSN